MKLFLALLAAIEHPRLLGLLVVANVLIFIRFARTVYRDPDDLADDVKDVALDLAAGHRFMDRENYLRVLGALFFVMVCASVVKAEYVLIGWIIS
jgi:hypothetical protein